MLEQDIIAVFATGPYRRDPDGWIEIGTVTDGAAAILRPTPVPGTLPESNSPETPIPRQARYRVQVRRSRLCATRRGTTLRGSLDGWMWRTVDPDAAGAPIRHDRPRARRPPQPIARPA